MRQTDVLVMGAGLAGAVTALRLADAGVAVTLLHRSDDDTNKSSYWAQGGIIYQGANDSPERLADDILKAGVGLSLPAAARLVAEEGPRLVREILVERVGVPFDRGPGGELHVTEEGAHSLPRIIHCADRTGRGIHEVLDALVAAHPNIELLRSHTAIDLLTLSHHSRRPLDIYEPNTCFGAWVLDRKAGEVFPIIARETVLATGGLGQLFLHTTNPRGARGDGIAMAYRAGARLLNLEYIQFHPTAFYAPHTDRFLISEAARGEGARLVLPGGEEFMKRYHDRGSLAPRDVVARAIHQEMMARDLPCVYLDLSDRPADWIRGRFPHIHDKLLEMGVDMTRQPIPVVPAAHYCCGGVMTDLDGQTTIRQLWAVGEVACTGLHGANRLASTSLLEAVVFGARAADRIIDRLGEATYAEAPPIDPWVSEKLETDPALILQDWVSIKYTMWNYVGLARNRRRLRRARLILRELQNEVENFYRRTRLDDDLIGLRNGVQSALAVLYAASENPTSRGCHHLENSKG